MSQTHTPVQKWILRGIGDKLYFGEMWATARLAEARIERHAPEV